jgi:signal transduction histidine kinase
VVLHVARHRERELPLRSAYFLFFAALTVAGFLAFAASDLGHERSRLFQDFAESEKVLATQLAGELAKELHEIDEDSRLVAGLVHRTSVRSAERDRATGALVHSAFEALAAVVRQYRFVGLFNPSGPTVAAPDPSERAETVNDFRAWSAEAAARATAKGSTVLDGPRESGGRQFYLYATPLEEAHAVVMVWDAPLFLQTVLRPRPAQARYFILDPSSTMWIGCGQPRACRGLPLAQWTAIEALGTVAGSLQTEEGATWGADRVAASLGLPQRSAVLAWHRIVGPDERPWVMGVVASAAALEAQERSLWKRLLMVSAAIVLSLSGAALVILRHLRRTAVLQERLRTAQEVATLREKSLSEIKSLEQQLVRAEKFASIGVLTAGLAHEIGTPLTIIRGRAESLQGQVSDATVRRGLDSVVAQIDHISATIRQVLDFSRAQPVELRPTDVRAAVTAVLALLDWRFRQQSIHVRVEADGELPRLAADPDQLQQVLVNLLMNAADACRAGGSIVVRLRKDGDSARVGLEIEDDGCGIPPENINAVFDPFFTTKKRGEGTGLGLPVVASIVRNHQGEISLSSEAGRGTRVQVWWPASVEHGRREEGAAR